MERKIQISNVKQSLREMEQRIRVSYERASSEPEWFFANQANTVLNAAWSKFERAQATENEQAFQGLISDIKLDLKYARLVLD